MATFGKTDDGASSSTSSTDKKNVSSATPASSGTVTGLSARIWVSAGSTTAKGIIYTDTAGAPDALLAVSDELTINNTSEAQIDFSFTGAQQKSITSGTAYWIGVHWKDPGTDNFTWSRAATAGNAQSGTDTYSDGPSDPFGAPSALSGPIDVFVTYTEAGGSALTQAIDDTVSLADSNIDAPVKNITDTLSLSDGFSRIATYLRTITDTVSLADNNKKSFSKNLPEVIDGMYWDGQSSSKITVPYNASYDLTGSAITLEAWVKLDTLPSETGREYEIIKHLKTTGGAVGFQMYIQNSGVGQIDTLRCELKNLTDTYPSGTGTSLSKNTWYHVACVYDGSNIITYLNGIADVTDSSSGTLISNTADLVLGNQNDSVNQFHGYISKARIYDKALTPTEVANRYHFNTDIRDGLVSEWLLNEKSGDTAVDSVAGANGTISGVTPAQSNTEDISLADAVVTALGGVTAWVKTITDTISLSDLCSNDASGTPDTTPSRFSSNYHIKINRINRNKYSW